MLRGFQSRLSGDVGMWIGGLIVGVVVGYAALAFILAIQGFQSLFYGGGASVGDFPGHVASLPYWRAWMTPIVAGCVVSAFLWFGARRGWLPETRGFGVADVIEARAVHGGRSPLAPAVYSSLAAAASLGGGASAGREGPAVHLGGAIAVAMGRWARLGARETRIILACGAGAAVAASFNAPIAGAVFAFEVVLGHYAPRAIAPVAISSTAAALVSRFHLGDQPAFFLENVVEVSMSFVDLPGAALLGAVCALVAVAFMRAILIAGARFRETADAIGLPLWALPSLGGVLLGAFAVQEPLALGVGYEATAGALKGAYGLWALLALVGLKLLATALSIGCRFPGGVFSPSLLLGAALGAAFGLALGQLSDAPFAPASFYALVGMGALSGAVLAAPLSTTLIAFELTQSYDTAVAVLVAVSLATVIVQRILGAGFFQLQIEAHGYTLREGPQRVILQTVRVKDFMTPIDAAGGERPPEGPSLYETDTLGKALALLEKEGLDSALVRARGADEPVVGYVRRADALIAYNRRLVDAHEERSR